MCGPIWVHLSLVISFIYICHTCLVLFKIYVLVIILIFVWIASATNVTSYIDRILGWLQGVIVSRHETSKLNLKVGVSYDMASLYQDITSFFASLTSNLWSNFVFVHLWSQVIVCGFIWVPLTLESYFNCMTLFKFILIWKLGIFAWKYICFCCFGNECGTLYSSDFQVKCKVLNLFILKLWFR